MKNLKIDAIDFSHGETHNWYNALVAMQTGAPGDYELRIKFRCIGEPDFTTVVSRALAVLIQRDKKLRERQDKSVDKDKPEAL